MICLTLASSPAVAFLSFLHFEKSLVTRFRVERWLTLHVRARSLTVEHRCTSCYCHCAESPAADMRSRHCGFRKKKDLNTLVLKKHTHTNRIFKTDIDIW